MAFLQVRQENAGNQTRTPKSWMPVGRPRLLVYVAIKVARGWTT